MDLHVYLERNALNIYRKSNYFERKQCRILYPINFLRNSYDFRDTGNGKRVKFVDNMRIFPKRLLRILVA